MINSQEDEINRKDCSKIDQIDAYPSIEFESKAYISNVYSPLKSNRIHFYLVTCSSKEEFFQTVATNSWQLAKNELEDYFEIKCLKKIDHLCTVLLFFNTIDDPKVILGVAELNKISYDSTNIELEWICLGNFKNLVQNAISIVPNKRNKPCVVENGRELFVEIYLACVKEISNLFCLEVEQSKILKKEMLEEYGARRKFITDTDTEAYFTKPDTNDISPIIDSTYKKSLTDVIRYYKNKDYLKTGTIDNSYDNSSLNSSQTKIGFKIDIKLEEMGENCNRSSSTATLSSVDNHENLKNLKNFSKLEISDNRDHENLKNFSKLEISDNRDLTQSINYDFDKNVGEELQRDIGDDVKTNETELQLESNYNTNILQNDYFSDRLLLICKQVKKLSGHLPCLIHYFVINFSKPERFRDSFESKKWKYNPKMYKSVCDCLTKVREQGQGGIILLFFMLQKVGSIEGMAEFADFDENYLSLNWLCVVNYRPKNNIGNKNKLNTREQKAKMQVNTEKNNQKTYIWKMPQLESQNFLDPLNEVQKQNEIEINKNDIHDNKQEHMVDEQEHTVYTQEYPVGTKEYPVFTQVHPLVGKDNSSCPMEAPLKNVKTRTKDSRTLRNGHMLFKEYLNFVCTKMKRDTKKSVKFNLIDNASDLESDDSRYTLSKQLSDSSQTTLIAENFDQQNKACPTFNNETSPIAFSGQKATDSQQKTCHSDNHLEKKDEKVSKKSKKHVESSLSDEKYSDKRIYRNGLHLEISNLNKIMQVTPNLNVSNLEEVKGTGDVRKKPSNAIQTTIIENLIDDCKKKLRSPLQDVNHIKEQPLKRLHLSSDIKTGNSLVRGNSFMDTNNEYTSDGVLNLHKDRDLPLQLINPHIKSSLYTMYLREFDNLYNESNKLTCFVLCGISQKKIFTSMKNNIWPLINENSAEFLRVRMKNKLMPYNKFQDILFFCTIYESDQIFGLARLTQIDETKLQLILDCLSTIEDNQIDSKNSQSPVRQLKPKQSKTPPIPTQCFFSQLNLDYTRFQDELTIIVDGRNVFLNYFELLNKIPKHINSPIESIDEFIDSSGKFSNNIKDTSSLLRNKFNHFFIIYCTDKQQLLSAQLNSTWQFNPNIFRKFKKLVKSVVDSLETTNNEITALLSSRSTCPYNPPKFSITHSSLSLPYDCSTDNKKLTNGINSFAKCIKKSDIYLFFTLNLSNYLQGVAKVTHFDEATHALFFDWIHKYQFDGIADSYQVFDKNARIKYIASGDTLFNEYNEYIENRLIIEKSFTKHMKHIEHFTLHKNEKPEENLLPSNETKIPIKSKSTISRTSHNSTTSPLDRKHGSSNKAQSFRNRLSSYIRQYSPCHQGGGKSNDGQPTNSNNYFFFCQKNAGLHLNNSIITEDLVHYFVVCSTTKLKIEQSMKTGLWNYNFSVYQQLLECFNNLKLDGFVLLFFTVYKSNLISGVAKLINIDKVNYIINLEWLSDEIYRCYSESLSSCTVFKEVNYITLGKKLYMNYYNFVANRIAKEDGSSHSICSS